MPEMPPVSTHAECAPVKPRPDVNGGSTPSHDPRAGPLPSPKMPGRNVSATKVSAAMTTAVSAAAVSRRRIGGER